MTEDFIQEVIQKNLGNVRTLIADACSRANRSPDDVRLVAVTKYADLKWVRALAELHPVFGENRPQQLAERSPLLPPAQWHLIGQLQRNKARLAVEHAAVIHSVDSLRLLERVASVAGDLNQRPQVLLQVNVSGEAAKSGFSPQALMEVWPDVARHQKSVDICGLMTMAPATRDPEEARTTFRGLGQLKTELAGHTATSDHMIELTELSMGMSGDFEVAIEEGATIVRIGSRLYESLQRDDRYSQ